MDKAQLEKKLADAVATAQHYAQLSQQAVGQVKLLQQMLAEMEKA